MKRLEVSSKRLNNGDIAVEMSYNQQNRTKKIIFFFIIAVIVGAMAFSACFFALEISRTNAYNNRLNNSIVQPEPETPPEIIEPSLPDDNNSITDNNEPGGSAPDEGETGAGSYAALTIKCVWAGENYVYSLDEGIKKATNNYDNMYLQLVDSSSKTADDEVRYLSFSSGNNKYSFNHGEYIDGLEAAVVCSNPAHEIGIFSGRSDPVTVKIVTTVLHADDFIISFMKKDNEGTMYDITSNSKFPGIRELSYTFQPSDWASGGTTIYAVVTKMVDVGVIHNDANGEITTKLFTEGGAYGDARLNSVKIYNCIFAAKHYSSTGYSSAYTVIFVFYSPTFGGNINISESYGIGGSTVPSLQNYRVQPGSSRSFFGLGDNICTWSFGSKTGETYLNTKFPPIVNGGNQVYLYNQKDAFANVTGGSTNYYCINGDEIQKAISILSSGTVTITYNRSTEPTKDVTFTLFSGRNYTFKAKSSNVAITMQKGKGVYLGSDSLVNVSWQVNINRLLIDNCNLTVSDCKISSLTTEYSDNIVNIEDKAKIVLLYVADDRYYSTTVKFLKTTGVLENLTSYGGKVVVQGNMSNDYASNPLKFNIDYDLTKVTGTAAESTYKRNEVNVNNIEYIKFNIKKLQEFNGEALFAFMYNHNGDKITDYNISYNYGSVKTSVSGGVNNEAPCVAITLSKTIFITCYEDLVAVAQQEGYPSDMTYVLSCDITLPTSFSGIGAYNGIPFTGTFDGNGYAIIFDWYSYQSARGLFYGLKNATVKNLIITGVLYSPGRYITQDTGILHIYYGLAFETRETVDIINVYSDLDFMAYGGGDSDKANPMVELVYQNYGTLNFINCAATGYIPQYTETSAKSEERSNFLGFNHKDAVVNFKNCVVKSSAGLHNSKNKNGLFVGWSNNAKATFANITFDNCYKVGSSLNPVVGGVGFSDPPTSNFKDDDFVGIVVNNTATIKDIEQYLNNWVENNKSTHSDLFDWYEGYFLTHKINSGDDLKNLGEYFTDSQGVSKQRTNFVGRAVKITAPQDTIYVTDWMGFDSFGGLFDGNNKTIHITGSQGLVAANMNDGAIIKNLNIAGEITGGVVGAIVGSDSSNDGIQYIQNCTNYATITGSISVGGILGRNGLGKFNISNCYNFGKLIATNNDVSIGGISGSWEFIRQPVSHCVVGGAIIVPDANDLPKNFGLFTTNGDVTSCVFMGEVKDKNGVMVAFASGTRQGAKFTAEGTATYCFAKFGGTQILNTPKNSDGSATETTYEGCSTFKDINKSLMYNGSIFNYLVNVLSDNTSTTNWVIEQKELIDGTLIDVPNYTETTKSITRSLEISDIDNLNAINNIIITNNISIQFMLYTFNFDDFELVNFAGLGDGSHYVNGGTWRGVIQINNGYLFDNVYSATIQYLTINSIVDTNKYTIAKLAQNCSFINCTNNASLTGDSTSSIIGGLVATGNYCRFTNCENYGNITGSQDQEFIGGIVGYYNTSVISRQIKECKNYGTIYTNSFEGKIGGIVGCYTGSASTQIIGNKNYGDIYTNEYLNVVGGIVGEAKTKLDVQKCENYGNLLGAGSIGGIVGSLSSGGNYQIQNCFTNCKIEAKTNAGGVVGVAYGEVVLQNCITEGMFIVNNFTARVAGIVGMSDANLNIKNCVTFALINNELNGQATTGVVNVNSSTATINNSYFFGDFISSNYYVFASGDNITMLNCGYNINNQEDANAGDAECIFVKNNPVWSSSAYIKLLFKTEMESMLDGTNTKLTLKWFDTNTTTTGTQSGFDAGFWNGVFAK